MLQGVTVFKDIIHWFEKQNNWMGWTCFMLLYCLNIAILLPGILWILAAGFVFGYAPLHISAPVLAGPSTFPCAQVASHSSDTCSYSCVCA